MKVNPGGEHLRKRTDELRQAALALGFSHVGFAAAEELSGERLRLSQWLAQGHHAGMGWMERDVEKRSDPRMVLPGARSVISVAMNYYTPVAHSDSPDIAKISRYAWGEDYHDVLGERLAKLEDVVRNTIPDVQTRRYVDTGPVMDKAWAVRAGIGWLGKNGNVITRDLGSWIFLGEILATCEFVYDEPIADYCGSCTSCIEACPTQAIVAPAVVDSRRCLSWLTIECRDEELPLREGMQMDGWVFGCDVCQDVCPWNSFAQESPEPGFHPRAVNVEAPLAELAQITDEEFRERFRRSPVKRCKPWGMRRNARTVSVRNESNIE
jgi:epoxyqueuosine reductase